MAIVIDTRVPLRDVESGFARIQQTVDQRMSAVEARLASSERTTQQFSQRSQRHLQSLTASYNSLVSTAARVTGILAAVGGGLTLTGLAKGAIETTASFEQLNTQLRFVSGSAERFQKSQEFIRQFTRESPFQIGEVTKAFVDLTRRGLDAERALRGIGDIAALQEFPTQALEGMIRAMRQIADLGRLNQEELNQMAESAGASTLRVKEELTQMGVALKADIGNSAISVLQAIEAINRVLEEDFAGAMAATAGNWKVITSNMADSWGILVNEVVEGPLFNFIKGLALVINDDMNRAIQQGGAAFDSFGARAVENLQSIGRQIAILLELMNSLIKAGTVVQESLGDLERRGAEVVGGLYNRIGQFFGVEQLTAKVQADAKQASEAVSEALMSGEILQSYEQLLTQANQKTEEAAKKREEILAKQDEKQRAQIQRLQAVYAKPGRTDADKAAREAGNIAAERARAEEQTLEASLRRQVEMRKIAADQQRQALDQELTARLAREPAAHEAIGQELKDRRRQIALEEAAEIERIEVDLQQRILAVTLTRLDAEIRGAAGKPAQIAKFEADKVAAVEDANVDMAKAAANRAQVEQQVSKQTLDQRLQDIEREVEAVEQGAQDVLDSRIRVMEAEQRLLETQLASQTGDQARQTQAQLDQLRTASFEAQIARIQQETEARAAAIETEITDEVRRAERVAQIRQEGADQEQVVRIEQQDREQRLLNEQLDREREMWENFGETVENSLGRVLFDGLKGNIKSLSDIWNRTLDFMLETFANFVAAIITQKIIIPVAMSLVGGLAGGILGGAGGTGGGGLFDLLGLAGVAHQGMGLFGGTGLGGLFGPTSAIGLALGNFTAMLNSATANVGGAIADVFGITNLPASGMTALGGLAGIGGGIYSALTAEGLGGMTGGAIGAAGGAAALVSGLGLIAPIFGPIGLALSALAPLLGNLIDTLGAPKGPRFVLGELEGLDVVVENGMLQVAGTLTSAIGKAERLPGGQSADKIQSALEAGVQDAVNSMVGVINAVALDPDVLLGPTQEALQTGLDNALRINSASAEDFAKDIAAQTLAVVTQIGVNFLGPLADALDQIFDADLDTQLRTLPNALNLAVTQLKKLTDAVTAIQESGQTDASNVVPQLLDQIAVFRKHVIDSTVDTLNEAFTGGIDQFQEALQLAVALPQGVIDLHAPLASVQGIAQATLAVENQVVGAIDGIVTAMTPLSEQMGDLHDRFNELNAELADAGENLAVALPLYAELNQAILQEANLRIQQVQAIGATLQTIEQTLFGQLTPAEQQEQLLADIAAKEAELATQTGSEAAETAAELAAMNQQLLGLGESTDNLALQMEAIANLEQLQPLLEQQLIALGGTTDVQQAIKNIQQQTLDTLRSMEEDLYNLFLSNTQVANALNLPVPVVVVGQAAQRGGILGLARGGLVPAMLEPGEAFFPAMNMGQQRALMAMNTAFPRFGVGGLVPGTGSGDIVPAFLPIGSGILNRHGVTALRGARGYQTGGIVSSGTAGGPIINVHVGGQWTVSREQDKRDIAREIAREMRDELRKLNGRTFGKI